MFYIALEVTSRQARIGGGVTLLAVAFAASAGMASASRTLERCSFKSRTLGAVALVAVATPSECSFVQKTYRANFVPFHGSYAMRCVFVLPSRPGWKFEIEARNASLGKQLCAAESKSLRNDGWVRTS